jgi:hypothetical protein
MPPQTIPSTPTKHEIERARPPVYETTTPRAGDI